MALNNTNIHTLNDPIQYTNKSTRGLPIIKHIPNLTESNEAESILKRIQNEFSEITFRRGYKITLLSELCCCDDGKHHHPNKKGKFRKMANNVLGYNLNRREIHLRLRNPHTHTFFPYEDIARTMCHELAHCEISPHNDEFFKLMDVIEQQHAEYLVKGVILDAQGFPVGSDQTHRLGGATSVGRRGKKNDAAIRVHAAEARAQKRKHGLGGSYVLGSNDSRTTKRDKSVQPKQAAFIAAQRRLREASQCLTHAEIIELLDDSDDDESDDDVIYIPNTTLKNDDKDNNSVQDDEDDDCVLISVKKTSTNKKQSDKKNTQWNCNKCTYLNANENALCCDVCGSPRQSSANTIQTIQEVEESTRTFNGFNIYGSTSQSSRTMDHLT